MIGDLVVGGRYSKASLANILGVPRIGTHREGPLYLPDIDAALLFVTLNKQNRPGHIRYRDWFDGDLFHWDSQNQQHIGSPRIKQMVGGELVPHLFVRTDDKIRSRTQEFLYVGRLSFDSYDEETSNPVHIVWRCLDYMEHPATDLTEVYGWTAGGGDRQLSDQDFDAAAVGLRGQRFAVDAKVRRAIELRAMEAAAEWYSGHGYRVTDTSARFSFDLECTRGIDERRRVEVKGTMNGPEFVYLTVNEVESARSGGVPTDLFIVHGIRVDRSNADFPKASGGYVHRIDRWKPQDDELVALQFRYIVPNN